MSKAITRCSRLCLRSMMERLTRGETWGSPNDIADSTPSLLPKSIFLLLLLLLLLLLIRQDQWVEIQELCISKCVNHTDRVLSIYDART